MPEGRGRRRRGTRTSPPLEPIGNGDDEGWARDVEDQDLRGICASRSSGAADVWQIEMTVAEVLREDPPEAELRRGIQADLRAAPGVVAVDEEDRETWLVTGIVDGRELVRAAGQWSMRWRHGRHATSTSSAAVAPPTAASTKASP